MRRVPSVTMLLVGCGDEPVGHATSESTANGSTGAISPPTGKDSGVSTDGGSATSGAAAETTGAGTTGAGTTGAGTTLGEGSSSGTDTASVNDGPEAVDDTIFAVQDTSLVLKAADSLLSNDSDPDGDLVTVAAYEGISGRGGTVVIAADGTLAYLPPFGFWGTDSFAYTIEDAAGATATASATVYVGPVRIPLAAVTAGVGGFVIDGEEGDFSGFPVSGAGDVNGDGQDDLVLGAYQNDDNGELSGRSYVVFGRVETAPVQLSTVAGGMGGIALAGEAAGDRSGYSVSGAGDVNGDGLDDVIIGAFWANANGVRSGRSYIVFGGEEMPTVQLSSVTAGSGGFVLEGEAEFDNSARSVSGAGDVNGDGLDDLIVGANGADPNGLISGRSYVVFGKADTTAVPLSAIAAGVGGFVLNGASTQDLSGNPVSSAGDVNGDGMDDLIIAAYRASPNGAFSGRSYVVFGKADTTPVELGAVAEGVGGFALDGEAGDDRSGISVSGAGDVNGDGMDDLIVGADGADPNGLRSGRTYVVFGKSDTTAVQLSAVTDGVGGFILDGEAGGNRSGRSVSGAGDVNGDGRSDLLVGAYRAVTSGGNFSGRSYVVFGKSDTAPVQLSSIASGMGGFVLDGETEADQSGISVSGAGDVNGDGIGDIIVGAPFADTEGENSGRSYVVFGVPTASD